MDRIIPFILTLCIIHSEGLTSQEQYDHIMRRRLESQGLGNYLPSRRAEFHFDRHETSSILGAPGSPNHLPEAEPILPGHTLIRPSFGMLKSAVKYPHRELEDGAGVLGNIDNLGIRWDGRNERVLYSGFRRMQNDGSRRESIDQGVRRIPVSNRYRGTSYLYYNYR